MCSSDRDGISDEQLQTADETTLSSSVGDIGFLTLGIDTRLMNKKNKIHLRI